MKAGIICFGESAGFPQDFPDEQMNDVLAAAEAKGWQVALHDFMRPLDAARYRRAVDEYRAQWRCLIPSSPTGRLLDLRCGWGPIAINLADDYGQVVAADTGYVPARFTALRAEEAGARNVQAMSLDLAQPLPFPTGCFNVIVLHDALEWAGDGLLAELGRVLAPGGSLFLNVENRWNLARALQRVKGSPAASAGNLTPPGPRPRFASLPGSRRTLAAAGLRLQSAYGILPSVSEPFFIVPLAQPAALKHFLDSLFGQAGLRAALSRRGLLAQYEAARAVWRLVRFLPVEAVAKYFLPGYGLLASKRD